MVCPETKLKKLKLCIRTLKWYFFLVFSVIYLFDSSAVQAAVELFESLRVDFLIVVVGPFDAVGVEVALEP